MAFLPKKQNAGTDDPRPGVFSFARDPARYIFEPGAIFIMLPPGAITTVTRLVLASAVYLKAAWAQPFPERQ